MARGFILILLCFVASPAWANGPECGDEVAQQSLLTAFHPPNREAHPRKVAMWNYFGHEGFESAGYLEFYFLDGYGYSTGVSGIARANGTFSSSVTSYANTLEHSMYGRNPAKAEVNSGSRGPTLIDRNQFFPLAVMQATGYIDDKKRNAQLAIPKILHPNQMLFFEVTSTQKGAELIDTYGRIPDNAREESGQRAYIDFFSHFEGFDHLHGDQSRNMTYEVKEGAAWILSGQPGFVRHPLYLENSALETRLDRDKHKFVWEVGRAGQLSQSGFYDCARVGVRYAARELILHGGELDDAYVLAHALTPLIGRVYSSVYKMNFFSRYRDRPRERAYVTSLESMLAIAKIEDFDPVVARLVKASNSQLAPFEALKLSLYAQQSRTEYLSAAGVHIQLRDFSNLSSQLVQLEVAKQPSLQDEAGHAAWVSLQRPPAREYRDLLAERARVKGSPYHITLQGRSVQRRNRYTQQMETVLQELDDFLLEHNAIEVTSRNELTPEVALTVAYWRAVQKLEEQGVDNPENKLKEWGVSFALYNQKPFSPDTLAPPVVRSSWFVHRNKVISAHPYPFTNYRETLVPEIHATAQIYSAEDVSLLAHAFDFLRGTFLRGSHHREQFLSNVELTGF